MCVLERLFQIVFPLFDCGVGVASRGNRSSEKNDPAVVNSCAAAPQFSCCISELNHPIVFATFLAAKEISTL